MMNKNLLNGIFFQILFIIKLHLIDKLSFIRATTTTTCVPCNNTISCKNHIFPKNGHNITYPNNTKYKDIYIKIDKINSNEVELVFELNPNQAINNFSIQIEVSSTNLSLIRFNGSIKHNNGFLTFKICYPQNKINTDLTDLKIPTNHVHLLVGFRLDKINDLKCFRNNHVEYYLISKDNSVCDLIKCGHCTDIPNITNKLCIFTRANISIKILGLCEMNQTNFQNIMTQFDNILNIVTNTEITTKKTTSASTAKATTKASTTKTITSASTTKTITSASTAKTTTSGSTAKTTTRTSTAKTITSASTAKTTTRASTAKATTRASTAKATTSASTAKTTTRASTAKAITSASNEKKTTSTTTNFSSKKSTTSKRSIINSTTFIPFIDSSSVSTNGLSSKHNANDTIHSNSKSNNQESRLGIVLGFGIGFIVFVSIFPFVYNYIVDNKDIITDDSPKNSSSYLSTTMSTYYEGTFENENAEETTDGTIEENTAKSNDENEENEENGEK